MNYHLFVVDEKSFQYHLEYMFVGTGKSDSNFDIELWKDIVRVKPGDKILFYVQTLKKFYGFFEIASFPFFDSAHFLQPQTMPFLGRKKSIKLQYRALIRPFRVFEKGIDEFTLIDLLPRFTKDILWSILYRKLKGGRGCSPLFEEEFRIAFRKISYLNGSRTLSAQAFTFRGDQIVSKQGDVLSYGGAIAIPLKIKQDVLQNSYSESHLHALLIDFFNQKPFTAWLGNEVYAGAGMQAIDILIKDQKERFNIIEVKKDLISPDIVDQIEKYLRWFKRRFQKRASVYFRPIVIGRAFKRSSARQKRIERFQSFNARKVSLPIIYIEYEVNAPRIDFYWYDYIRDKRHLFWSI